MRERVTIAAMQKVADAKLRPVFRTLMAAYPRASLISRHTGRVC